MWLSAGIAIGRNCRFESRSGLLRTKVYSAFHPSVVGKWVPVIAGKAKVWLIPIADERVDVQVNLWNPLRTRVIPEHFCSGDSLRRGAISSVCTFTFTRTINVSQLHHVLYVVGRAALLGRGEVTALFCAVVDLSVIAEGVPVW